MKFATLCASKIFNELSSLQNLYEKHTGKYFSTFGTSKWLLKKYELTKCELFLYFFNQKVNIKLDNPLEKYMNNIRKFD